MWKFLQNKHTPEWLFKNIVIKNIAPTLQYNFVDNLFTFFGL